MLEGKTRVTTSAKMEESTLRVTDRGLFIVVVPSLKEIEIKTFFIDS